MTARQKFWLKVVLTVTFPLWAVPTLFAVVIGLVCLLVWEIVSSIVDPRPSHGLGGGR